MRLLNLGSSIINIKTKKRVKLGLDTTHVGRAKWSVCTGSSRVRVWVPKTTVKLLHYLFKV